MLKCKNCGAKVSEDERFCPTCGEPLRQRDDEPAVAAQPAPDLPPPVVEAGQSEPEVIENGGSATEAGPETLSEAQSEPIEPPSPPVWSSASSDPVEEPAKKSRRPIVVSVVCILLVVGILAGLVVGGIIPLGGFGKAGPSTVVATMKNSKLTNQQLTYYYWDEAYDAASYGMVAFDTDFAEQAYVDESYANWHDALVDYGVDTWAYYTAIYNAAVAAGHVMDDEIAGLLATLRDDILADAVEGGYESADLMLQESYGPLADVDSFCQYVELRYMAISYANSMFDEMLEPYMVGVEPKLVNSVNIRHILIGMGDDAAAAQAEAEAIYADWQTVGTEDYFAQLAMEHSQDGNAADGGIYEAVAPGMMVATFNDWLFDPARQVGDHGIVETQFGYHVMYLSGFGEPVEDSSAEQEAQEKADADFSVWMDQTVADSDYIVFQDKVSIA